MNHLKVFRQAIVFTGILALEILFPKGTWAATIEARIEPVMGCNILITGTIIQGDSERLRRLIVTEDGDYSPFGEWFGWPRQPFGRRICFNSPGGSMPEGVELARVILDSSYGTAVAAGHHCESACALAFMAGRWQHPFYESNGVVDRMIHPTARLGFHAPSLEVQKGAYSDVEVQLGFALALESLASIAKLRSDNRYRFPESLLVTLLETPSSQMYYVDTVGRASRLDIQVVPSAFFESDIRSAFVNFCLMAGSRYFDVDVNDLSSSAISDAKEALQIRATSATEFQAEQPLNIFTSTDNGCLVEIKRLASDEMIHATDWVGNVRGWAPDGIWPFQSFPAETPIEDLPTDVRASWLRFWTLAVGTD